MSKIIAQVKPIDGRNLSRILEIEQSSFSCPWTLEDIVRMYRSQEMSGVSLEVTDKQPVFSLCSKTRSKCEIVGFLFFYRRGEDTIEIWNMAVDPKFRRQGYGTILIEHIKRKLTLGSRRKKIHVALHEDNLRAQLFLRSCGFLCEEIVGFERNNSDSKPSVSADVYMMMYREPFIPRNRLQFGGFVDASNI